MLRFIGQYAHRGHGLEARVHVRKSSTAADDKALWQDHHFHILKSYLALQLPFAEGAEMVRLAMWRYRSEPSRSVLLAPENRTKGRKMVSKVWLGRGYCRSSSAAHAASNVEWQKRSEK